MLKPLLIILGSLSLGLGALGVVVPGLPTTPFLLLAAGLYLRSSDRLYRWLIAHPGLGKYILGFQKNKGMSRRQKWYAIILMWFMILISCLFFLDILWVRILIIALGIAGTVVMGFLLPTIKKS